MVLEQEQTERSMKQNRKSKNILKNLEYDEDGISNCVLGQGQRPVSDAHQTYLVTVPSVVEASLSSRISIAELNYAFEGGIRVHCKVFSVKQPVPSNSGQRLNFLKVLRI